MNDIRSRHDEMREQCQQFHEENPKVWTLFEQFTYDRIKKGCEHYSARGVFHRIRWETVEAKTGESAFKLNDNHTPFYARRFMKLHPEHDGFFRTRRQISKDDDPTNRPQLGPEFFS
jgi:hypothetical protein